LVPRVKSSPLDSSLVAAPILEAANLMMVFGNVKALDGLNLRIYPGEIYGLLGPNGAGKSTAMKIVGGLLEPTSGTVSVISYDPTRSPVEVKSRIGYVAENPVMYESLSPRDFFEFIASVRKMDQESTNRMVEQLVTAFDMAQYFDSPIATLSMGTKQKVAVIASLLHRPQLLLLDEPLNGLDARSSRILKDMLSLHAQGGGAVLFSTHIMEVAERICTRIGIIYRGRILAEGTLDQLRHMAGGRDATLEEVFLKLTNEEAEVADTVKTLREAFFANGR
jgi:ABC-2 type transport system ATP-binding protein